MWSLVSLARRVLVITGADPWHMLRDALLQYVRYLLVIELFRVMTDPSCAGQTSSDHKTGQLTTAADKTEMPSFTS